ncbi:MAG: hypothetical protein CM15mP123_09940 [Gammaproteobacteria bacterium]|nr:MAG: hypothetical protein CM15mP123_09940 [Gammaproteobacteria bacterium]|tara:strand:- start:1304 stop:2242 length:939 start_codon:yes stop_codon:yes gene_type:complete
MNETIEFKSGQQGYLEYKSSNPFEFYHILNELDKAPQIDAQGWLIFPEKGKGPFPVIFCVHGSDNWAGHHHEHILNFLEAGFAIFRVHSFDSRGVASTVEDQMSVTAAMMMVDTFEALKIVSRHPDIDPSRIGITGWSLGGTVSFYSFWEPLAEKLAPNGERFKCCLPFYPATYIKPEENRWNSGPILNLVGESDNYTPASLVHQMSDIVNSFGGNSSVISYPGGEHSFDSINPVTHWPDAIAVSEKFCTVSKDGNMTYETDSGEKLGMNQPEDRLTIFESGEIHFGASTGGDWTIRRQCQKDAVNFFKENL